MKNTRHRGRRRCGFSLLEVILALAILTGAIAVLGEVVRLGVRNAQVARDMTQAQLLCESKLAEITAGITPSDPVQAVRFQTSGDPDAPDWLYSISREDYDQEGLEVVCVTVVQDLPPEKHPVEFSLVRWIGDSDAQTSQETGSESLSGGGYGE